MKGLNAFAVSPGDKPLLAAFCPEAKGQPAGACVVDTSPGCEGQLVVKKAFYRASGKRLQGRGQGCIVLTRMSSVACQLSWTLSYYWPKLACLCAQRAPVHQLVFETETGGNHRISSSLG